MASRCSRQSAMSIAVKGARHRLGRQHRVAAEGEVDQVVGEIGLERDQPGRVGILDVDEAEHRRAGDLGGGVGELGDPGGADAGADHRLDQQPHAVLDAAGEGLAEQLGVGERRAGDPAVPELLGEDVGGGGHRRRASRSGRSARSHRRPFLAKV